MNVMYSACTIMHNADAKNGAFTVSHYSEIYLSPKFVNKPGLPILSNWSSCVGS